MSDQKDKGAEYKVFLESCLGGSVDDTDGHDKRLLGPIGEILEEKEDKDSDSKDDTQKNTTVCFNLNDSENESSGFGDDDDDDEWDLEDAYNFDAEKIAELLQKGGEINEEELVESMQESMAEAMFLRMNLEDPDLEAERPDCSGTLDGRMTPPAKDAKDFDAATPPDPKVLAEKLEMKDRRRSSISGRRNINDAVKTNTARTRKSIACVAAEKTASGADKATIELAAEKTTKRHRMSLCKAAETLDLAGLGDDAPEEVQKKINMISKCLMVARGRHRMNVAAAVKETICGESDEEETKTAKSEGKSSEAKSSKDGPSDSKEASAPKATPKPKFMSKLRACAKEFQPSEKQLSIKQKIAAAVAAAYKRNGPVEKPEKSEVKEEWTTAYEDMSLYGYEDYSWQGQYGCDGSYGWNQMNCNQMGCNQMNCNQMGYNQMNQMAYNQMQYQQTGYNQMACGGCGMGCQGRNQWQGNQWQGQVNNAAVSNAAAPTEPSVAPPPVLEQGNLATGDAASSPVQAAPAPKGNLPPAESAVLPPIAPPSESPKDDETKKAQNTLPPINGALPAQSPKQEAPAGKSEEPLPPIDGEAPAPSDSILDTVADALVEHAEQAGPEASQAKAQKELQPERNEKVLEADKTQPNTTTSQEPTEMPENGQAAEAAEEAHEPQEEEDTEEPQILITLIVVPPEKAGASSPRKKLDMRRRANASNAGSGPGSFGTARRLSGHPTTASGANTALIAHPSCFDVVKERSKVGKSKRPDTSEKGVDFWSSHPLPSPGRGVPAPKQSHTKWTKKPGPNVHTIRRRFEFKSTRDEPGPGEYPLNRDLKSVGNGNGFAKSLEKRFHPGRAGTAPGPGSYATEDKLPHGNIIQHGGWSISGRARRELTFSTIL